MHTAIGIHKPESGCVAHSCIDHEDLWVYIPRVSESAAPAIHINHIVCAECFEHLNRGVGVLNAHCLNAVIHYWVNVIRCSSLPYNFCRCYRAYCALYITSVSNGTIPSSTSLLSLTFVCSARRLLSRPLHSSNGSRRLLLSTRLPSTTMAPKYSISVLRYFSQHYTPLTVIRMLPSGGRAHGSDLSV